MEIKDPATTKTQHSQENKHFKKDGRPLVKVCLLQTGQPTNQPKVRRKFLEVMDMFIIFNGVMVSWVYLYVETHQVVYIKEVFLFLFSCQSYFDTGVNH